MVLFAGAQYLGGAEPPPPGDGFVYLMRGESPVCGLGTLGFGSYGVARVNTGNACFE